MANNLEKKIKSYLVNFSGGQYKHDDIDPDKYYAFEVKEDGTIDKGDAIKDKKGYDSKIEAEQAIGDKPNCTVVRGSTLITQYPHLFK